MIFLYFIFDLQTQGLFYFRKNTFPIKAINKRQRETPLKTLPRNRRYFLFFFFFFRFPLSRVFLACWKKTPWHTCSETCGQTLLWHYCIFTFFSFLIFNFSKIVTVLLSLSWKTVFPLCLAISTVCSFGPLHAVNQKCWLSTPIKGTLSWNSSPIA